MLTWCLVRFFVNQTICFCCNYKPCFQLAMSTDDDYQIILVGAASVGKTCIIRKWTKGEVGNEVYVPGPGVSCNNLLHPVMGWFYTGTDQEILASAPIGWYPVMWPKQRVLISFLLSWSVTGSMYVMLLRLHVRVAKASMVMFSLCRQTIV